MSSLLKLEDYFEIDFSYILIFDLWELLGVEIYDFSEEVFEETELSFGFS